MNKDTIYHHGILGMKWGKRNGPPYPLSPGDHSASEKKAGWRKSLGGGSTYKAKKKQAKIERNARDRKIQEEYDRTEASIEKKYKRGQALSDKDYARELEADNKAIDAWKKSKEQYRQDINNAKKEKKIEKVLNSERLTKKYAQKGYAQDSYNSNKTALGKLYDSYTGAHKIAGELTYDNSTGQENQKRAALYISDKYDKIKRTEPVTNIDKRLIDNGRRSAAFGIASDSVSEYLSDKSWKELSNFDNDLDVRWANAEKYDSLRYGFEYVSDFLDERIKKG